MSKFRKINTEAGFTLIELLVVIAIIGILSGIVLTSLAGARDKAQDARVKANLSGFRTAAELYYSEANTYHQGSISGTNVCGNPVTAPYYSALPGVSCTKNARSYAVSATLSDGTTWCVDSGGYFSEGVASGAFGDSLGDPAGCAGAPLSGE